MDERLRRFLTEVERDLGGQVALSEPSATIAPTVPMPLRELYQVCDGGDLLFGTLHSQAEGLELGGTTPFQPDWFPFGQTSNGDFWLCARQEINGLWFTAWDHDAGVGIDGAVESDLSSFLAGEFATLLEERQGLRNWLVIHELKDAPRHQVSILLKRVTALSTPEIHTGLNRLPSEWRVADPAAARSVLGRLRELGVEGCLRLEFL